MIKGECDHCGAIDQLYREREDGDITCLKCGWREPPEEVSDLPQRTAGVDRAPKDGGRGR
jgi:uncharacterized Zn finger protein (UPF0148 family)